MDDFIYPPLLDSSRKFLESKKVFRYRMKKVSEMSSREIIKACHFYVEENNLTAEWEDFRRKNEKG